RKQLALGDLYKTQGIYTYAGGWNWRAVVATLLGCALAWGGLIIPAIRPLYDYAWFVGLFVAGGAYIVLMKGAPEVGGSTKLETVSAPEID
ncbi:MAG TPA: cytosine permease, partial [Blastocatellia bacterium]|nr:cytosine permease [Blastocatellia bacterium]